MDQLNGEFKENFVVRLYNFLFCDIIILDPFKLDSSAEKKLLQDLEMNFHTSSYEHLVNIESGLNNICKHLYDYLKVCTTDFFWP